MANNNGALSGKTAEHDPDADMAAFDRLPRDLRKVLRDAFVQFQSQSALALIAANGAIPDLFRSIIRDMESRKAPDARACYGPSHPQADHFAPRGFFKPLRARKRIRYNRAM